MSKLRKVTIVSSLGGAYINKSYDAQLEYDTKDKRFFIRIPDDQLEFEAEDPEDQKMVSQTYIRGKAYVPAFVGETEDEVLKTAEKYYQIFLPAIRAERKVILYRITYRTKNIKGNKSDHYQQSTARVSSVLEIDFLVADETRIGSRLTYIRRYEEKDPFKDVMENHTDDVTSLIHGYGSTYKIMEWTEGREEFFQNVMDGMEAMIERIEQVVGEGKDSLIARIDSGTKLLTDNRSEADH